MCMYTSHQALLWTRRDKQKRNTIINKEILFRKGGRTKGRSDSLHAFKVVTFMHWHILWGRAIHLTFVDRKNNLNTPREGEIQRPWVNMKEHKKVRSRHLYRPGTKGIFLFLINVQFEVPISGVISVYTRAQGPIKYYLMSDSSRCWCTLCLYG